jgi:hypothetical protein
VEGSLFHDRPTVLVGRVYFVSVHEKPAGGPFRSWAAVYAVGLGGEGEGGVSASGYLGAVASYGDRPWVFDFRVLEMEASPFRCLPQQSWRSRGGGARRPGLRRLEKQGRGGGAP